MSDARMRTAQRRALANEGGTPVDRHQLDVELARRGDLKAQARVNVAGATLETALAVCALEHRAGSIPDLRPLMLEPALRERLQLWLIGLPQPDGGASPDLTPGAALQRAQREGVRACERKVWDARPQRGDARPQGRVTLAMVLSALDRPGFLRLSGLQTLPRGLRAQAEGCDSSLAALVLGDERRMRHELGAALQAAMKEHRRAEAMTGRRAKCRTCGQRRVNVAPRGGGTICRACYAEVLAERRVVPLDATETEEAIEALRAPSASSSTCGGSSGTRPTLGVQSRSATRTPARRHG